MRRDTNQILLAPQDIARFWSKVDRSAGSTDCWPWIAATDGRGYGAFKLLGIVHKSHRIAFILNGGDPGNFLVCHKCDNPPCCNPDHHFAGTHLDNMEDMAKKGRGGRFPRVTGQIATSDAMVTEADGYRPRGNLSAPDVAAIRAAYATGRFSGSELATLFGVTRQNISYILRGETWAATQ